MWVRFVLDKISSEKPDNAVITDCRYANEFVESAEFASENGYIFVPLRIVRPKSGLEGPLGEHESERNCENIPAIIVSNDGTLEDLYEKIDFLMSGDVEIER